MRLALGGSLPEIMMTLAPAYNAANRTTQPGQFRFDWRAMADAMRLPALAELLRGCDPAKTSTEDKLLVR